MAAGYRKGRQGRKTAQAPQSKSPERQSRGVMIRVNPDGLTALRLLAVELDTHIQALGVEALNDLLRKHGKRTVVRNPSLDTEDVR